MQEEKVCSSAYFITLTYDNENLPFNLKTGQPILCKSDLQKFWKRLRKRHQKEEIPMAIKYYVVGEYGGRTKRPHYHAIVFNSKPELMDEAWGMGLTHFGSVTPESCFYTLKYMQKNRKYFHTRNPGLTPEFACMSQGIGISYLENPIICNWHIKDMVNRNYVTFVGGQKIAMPRYYKERLYLENEKSLIAEVLMKQATEKQIKKLEKWEAKDYINHRKAIEAAFERMEHQSFKTKI